MRGFLQQYPKTEVELVVTNRVLDLIAEGVDLAIRAGELADSRLIAKRFSVGNVGLWASPAYLKKRGMPSHPRDLAPQECLQFSLFKNNRLELTNGKDTARFVPAGRLRADDFEALKAFALLGEGIVYLPSFMCAEEAKQVDSNECYPIGTAQRQPSRWSTPRNDSSRPRCAPSSR